MNKPTFFSGAEHCDSRGRVAFNNSLILTGVKRAYCIENASAQVVRAWQGHKIERRWFLAVRGSFTIKAIKIDNWEKPSKDLVPFEFILDAQSLESLALPAGYISSIQQLKNHSKLMVFADYELGEIQDEYRFDANYFKVSTI
jgi:dTDP-4-dehydrorhamnose 3,5-epimerase-like enzyme